jgi:hypothetical protein
VVLAGVDTYNIYEKCFPAKPAVYSGGKVRFIINILNLGDFGKSCLEKEKGRSREDEMKLAGWIFLIVSWGIILGLTAFCFIKVFSKKEIK